VDRPEIAALIRFAALTGCRVGEARALRWDWIDGPRAALPDSKSGPKAIWLGETARRLLAALPNSCAFVFARGGKPIDDTTLWHAWSAVRADARLEGVRLHDLRHGFASVAVGAGETLHTVAGLLGHSELAVTQGYAQFAEAPVREAADRVGEALDASLRKGGRGHGRDAPGVSREDAYAAVQGNSMKVWRGEGRFIDFLKADPVVSKALSDAVLEELFDYGYHTKNVDVIFRRVFGEQG
jgi:hypothetical protein